MQYIFWNSSLLREKCSLYFLDRLTTRLDVFNTLGDIHEFLFWNVAF